MPGLSINAFYGSKSLKDEILELIHDSDSNEYDLDKLRKFEEQDDSALAAEYYFCN